MKIVIAGAVAALALAGATLVAATPATARVNFGVSINVGDVQFAYRDGYWDRWHRWHAWRDPDDWRWYRERYSDRYFDWQHDRDPDMGWRVAGGPVVVPGFSFAVNDVQYAYQDGYWDRWHRWHAWNNRAEWIWWRNHYPDRYWDWRHDRDRDMGWRGRGGVGVHVGVPGINIGIGMGGPVGISVGFGDVAFAYRDGYWDRDHRWHAWRDRDDWHRFHDAHPDQFHDWNHDRDRDMGWHDNH